MKIVGILILLLGLFMIVIGAGAAAFFAMNTGPEFTCKIAERSNNEAANTQRKIAAANSDEAARLNAQYEQEKRTAAVDTQQCEQMKTQQRVFSIAGGVVAVIGLLLTVGGIGALIFAFRRKVA